METPKRISFDRIAHLYDRTRAIPEPLLSNTIDTMQRYLDKGERILDIGVGTGRFALPLQERGFQVVGIDISRMMLGIGVSKGTKYLVQGDASFLSFKSKVFHSTLSIHLLHLLPDWKNALAEAIRVTRENLITVTQYWPDEETPYSLYHELISESRQTQKEQVVHESDLPDLVRPQSEEYIGTRKEVLSAEEGIKHLENKIYPSLWDVPKDIHESAIREVRRRLSGRELEVECQLRLLIWKIEDLRRALIEPLGATLQRNPM